MLSMGVKYQLYSYFYFRTSLRGRDGGKAKTLLARMRRAHDKGYRFFLDSGAFTFQQKSGKAALPSPDAYFKEYLQFCREYGDLFDIIAEFDVDNLMVDDKPMPIEQLNDWIDQLIATVKHKAMPVYHEDRGMQWLHRSLVDVRTPYIGFGSRNTDIAPQIITKAHYFGKWIHGFGQTGINTSLKTLNFNSVDSTTWLRADKFGGTNIFKNGKWIVLDHLHKQHRSLHKDFYDSWGLDFDLIMKEDLHELRRANIVAWRELGNSFEVKNQFLTKGKLPYMLQMHRDGTVPREHPYITKARAEGRIL